MKTVTFDRPVTLGEGQAKQEFKKGTHQVPNELCQGFFFDALKQEGWAVVGESDQQDAAQDPGTPVSLLEGSVKEVLAALEAHTFTDDALLDLLAKEQAGKNRVTVVNKITELIEGR